MILHKFDGMVTAEGPDGVVGRMCYDNLDQHDRFPAVLAKRDVRPT